MYSHALHLSLLLLVFAPASTSLSCSKPTRYNLTLNFLWTAETDKAIPTDLTTFVGFSNILCLTHSPQYILWENKQPINSNLSSILRSSCDKPLLNFNTSLSRLTDTLVSPAIILPDSPASDSRNATLLVGGRSSNSPDLFTQLSCFAKIEPSPGWFIGLSQIELCEPGNSLLSSYRFDLRGWISGLYRDETYVVASPTPFNPPASIALLLGFASRYAELTLTTGDNPMPDTTATHCFPAHQSVQLRDGTFLPMSRLAVGHVLAADAGEVYMFSHRDEYVWASFVTLRLKSSQLLTLSAGHLIFRWTERHAQELVRAGDVRVGDCLVGGEEGVVDVIGVGNVWAKGLYNPHTMSGLMVLAGVKVSVYTVAVKPAVARGMLAPVRGLYMSGWGGLAKALGWLLRGSWNEQLAALLSWTS
eukprot:GFKZ01006343.1.p1 GENE.GFKZ01006343.1~~GFKZ01006343.1.p1  ORF type:complete len:418 (-),score=37.97 GFKZ01006343.1:1570-2823(-)